MALARCRMNCASVPNTTARRSPPLLWVIVLTTVCLARIGAAEPFNPDESTELPQLFRTYGEMSATYLFRTTSDGETRQSDHDLTEQLWLGITMPRSNLFEFHFLGTLKEELDGGSDVAGFFPYEDIENTRMTGVFGYVREFRLDINNLFPFADQIRAGRQTGTRDEPVSFDGLAIDVGLSRMLMASLYGGAALHFYEMDYAWGSDWLGGIGLDFAPTDNLWMSLDYLFVHDAHVTAPPFQNHLVALKGWARPISSLRTMMGLRLIDSSVRDLRFDAVATFPRIDLEISASYNLAPAELSELSTELSAYEGLLGNLYPYHSIEGKARKLFGHHLGVDLGVYLQRILEDADPTIFNRNHDKVFAIIELNDLLLDGLSVTVGGEGWRSEDRTHLSAALDAGYRSPRGPRGVMVGVGAEFGVYHYDYYPEIDNQQSLPAFYADGELPLGKCFALSARFEVEGIEQPHHLLKVETRYEY